MWKYITIFAYIGLAFGAFVFYKNFDAMVTEKGDETVDGEIITLQERFLTAIEKNKQRDFSETTQRYAEMREAWYKSEVEYYDKVTQRARELKEQYESETNATREKNRALQEDIDRLKSELDKTKRELAAIMEMEVSDDFNMAEFGKTVATLKHNNDTTELKVADEVKTIENLDEQNKRLTALLEEAKKTYQERQLRISPEELKCTVCKADQLWDYVILDAGIDHGIVIGSRLAAMRNGEQVAELNVTTVERNRASAKVIYNTLRTGDRVKVGDSVIAVRKK
ncbi:MAG: hypothetical protein PUD60_10435 [Akkermansia muciniphila]|nr:hypothetical protein [Akkermansia muciniphila]MCI7005710.1 hypothetical protein [Akkermansia muciniphila]MDD6814796.1 hypothetical protein [Akkermansia muciniphila]